MSATFFVRPRGGFRRGAQSTCLAEGFPLAPESVFSGAELRRACVRPSAACLAPLPPLPSLVRPLLARGGLPKRRETRRPATGPPRLSLSPQTLSLGLAPDRTPRVAPARPTPSWPAYERPIGPCSEG